MKREQDVHREILSLSVTHAEVTSSTAPVPLPGRGILRQNIPADSFKAHVMLPNRSKATVRDKKKKKKRTQRWMDGLVW